MRLLFAIMLFLSSGFASETVKGIKQDYQSFKQEMNEQLDEAEKNLEVLKEKSQNKITAAQNATLQELQTTQEKLKNQLATLKAESVKASKKVKSDLATSISNLNMRIQKALKE